MKSGHKLSLFYAFMAAVLFGGCAPVAKVLLENISPAILAAYLYMGSGIGLYLYLLLFRLAGKKRHVKEAALKKEDYPWVIAVTVFGGVLAPVTLMFSLDATPAATAALLLNFESVATTLIAVFLFREAVGKRIWAALGLITFSCILLSYDPESAFGFSLAAFGILLACTFWACDNNLSRVISSKDPIPIVAAKGVLAGIISFMIAIAIGEPMPGTTDIAAALVFGFLSYGGLTSVLFLLALRGIGTSRTGALLAVSPFFGVAGSFILFTEIPGQMFYVSLPVMAAGAYLLLTEKHSHLHTHPAEIHEHRHRHDDLHHDHGHKPDDPPFSSSGEHSHLHEHRELTHDHHHTPDIHHRHEHK